MADMTNGSFQAISELPFACLRVLFTTTLYSKAVLVSLKCFYERRVELHDETERAGDGALM